MNVTTVREFVACQEQERLSRWDETLAALTSVAQGKVASGESVHAWLESWVSGDERPPPMVVC